eukprot:ANDGO_03720.mRNA.1 CLPTM1-like membrane protein cnrB
MVANAGAAPAQGRQQGGFSWVQLIFQVVSISIISRYIFGGGSAGSSSSHAVSSGGPVVFTNAWSIGTKFDVHIYTSGDSVFDFETASLFESSKGLTYDWIEPNEVLFENTWLVSRNVEEFISKRKYLHAVFAMSDVPYPPDCLKCGSSDVCYQCNSCVHVSRRIIEDAAVKNVAKINLLTDGSATPASASEPRVVPHFVPDILIQLVVDDNRVPEAQLVAPVKDYVKVNLEDKTYKPITFFNEFYMMKDHRVPLNDTVEDVHFKLSISMTSNWKFMLSVQMISMFSQQKSMGMSDDRAEEDMKRMFIETNPILLGVTMTVSLLHMIFEFLAFKNDIQFWKNNKSLEGLSVRTVFINCLSQLVIFLYLLDNETSWMIVLSSGIGVLIEFWKINRVVNVSWDFTRSVPRVRFATKESYNRSRTREFDEIATRYLSYAAGILMVGYTVYSIVYESHKGWYSFVVNTLVGFIYVFGFIALTPQLFINYKLKSVAHLPWRTFIYKFLNTFIDDLFAFVIKMPTLHRIACLRDDVVFLLLLYQRWIYPVDKQRTESGSIPESPSVAGNSQKDEKQD